MSLLLLLMFVIPSVTQQSDNGRGSEWIELFDGASLEQWKGVDSEEIPEVWEVEDGWLKVVPNWTWGDDLVTREEFINFDLEFEWQLSPGANSGVKYLVDLERRNPVREEFLLIAEVLSVFLLIVLILLISSDQSSRRRIRGSTIIVFLLFLSCLYVTFTLWQPGSSAVGLELQLVDGGTSLSETETSGALYDLMAPNAVVSLPPGQINSSRIRVFGNLVEHWINGRKVLEFDLPGQEFASRLSESKFASLPALAEKSRGFIALQNHQSEVWFRNIRIRRLDVGSAPD